MNAPSHKQSISLTSGTRGGKTSKSITRPERQTMEDFSGLALPPLFGGNILEAELESGTGGVELDTEDEVDLGPGSSELLEGVSQEVEERRALEKRKYLVLNKRCKEIEQVNQRILSRLHQVQKLTRRFKKERRFLMKTLDARGDDYRNAQLTILLEDEHYSHLDSATGAEDERINGVANSSPSLALQNTSGPKKKRHRVPKQEKDKDPQAESDMSMLADMQFGEFPTPASLSH